MKIAVHIKNVQHIKDLFFSIDLSKHRLMGIVGRNGVGKTTLIKSLLNVRSADTFKKTSADSIFNANSSIEYYVGDETITFSFDPSISSLNTKQVISDDIRGMIDVELPMPFGHRFNFYQSISSADTEIRQAVVLEEYSTPQELVEFLNDIYSSEKFNDLVEIKVKGDPHYCITLAESRYVREDYLSSGEYFLINLYRKIQSRCKLIVIDEIDISLDAAAQVHLVRKLRDFCKKYEVNVIFTTHSLAMMQTLEEDELFQMRIEEDQTRVIPESYAFIKSTLYGFKGADRYILTEDLVLSKFLSFIIMRYCYEIFFEYKIIHVGAAPIVVDLMRRNAKDEFLAEEKNVISVLDGDQVGENYAKVPNVLFIPIDSVEKELLIHYQDDGDDLPKLGSMEIKNGKTLYRKYIEMKLMSELKIFEYVCSKNEERFAEFAKSLSGFLSTN